MNRSPRLASSSSSVKNNPHRLRSLARAAVEAVEARRLLASVSGVVFNDANANGTRQAGEAGLNFEVVYADRNNNNTYDAGDVATRTDTNGAYKLANLSADGATFTVRVRGDTAARVVSPAGNGYSVKLTTASPDLIGKDFAVKPVTPPTTGTVTVAGRAYVDHDFSNSYTTGDITNAGAVFVDLNGNFALDAGEPSTTRSGSDGSYSLAGVPAGRSSVQIVFANFNGSYGHLVIDTPAAGATLRDVDVHAYPSAAFIIATPFSDSNGDGVRQSDEPSVKLLDLWTDDNGNGIHDAGEQTFQFNTFDPSKNEYNGFVPTVAANSSVSGYATTLAYRRVGDADNRADGTYRVQLSADSNVGGITTPLVAIPLAPTTPPTTASLTGRVTNDANGNGVADAGEAGLANEVVYLDKNNNSIYDAGDVATRTDANGNYTLAGVALDGSTAAVRLRGIVAPRTVTAPAGAAYVLTLNAASTKTNLNFGVSPTAVATTKTVTIVGRAFVDRDSSNTYTAGDGTAVGTVYADLNANFKLDAGEPSTQRAADGTFTLSGVPAGKTVNIVALNVDGTSTFKILTTTTPAAGGTVTGFAIIAPAPAQPTTATVSGRVFDDANNNGVADAGEAAFADVFVYADYNGNGRADAGEPSDTTDAAGAYALTTTRSSFAVRLGGSPTLDQTLQQSGQPFAQVTPANDGGVAVDVTSATAKAGVNFNVVNASYVRLAPQLSNLDAEGFYWLAGQPAYAWVDANRNGIRDAAEPVVSGDSRYADSRDQTNPNAQPYYDFLLKRGTYTIAFGNSAAVNASAAATTSVTVGASSPVLVYPPPVTVPTVGASVSGFVFNDANGNGARDAGERPQYGGVDPAFAEFVPFADYNQNGVLDAGEPSGYVSYDASRDDLTYAGYYVIHGIEPGRAFSVRLTNLNETDAALAQTSVPRVTVAANQFLRGVDLGVADRQPTTATISGRAFLDNDFSGTYSTGDTTTSTIVFADLNKNFKADAGEPATTPAADGTFTLAGAPAGQTFNLVALGISGPGTGKGYTITTPAAGGTVSGVAIYAQPARTATVSGRVFNDFDRDAFADPDETGIVGALVFADYDGNGVPDVGEPSTTTGTDGRYSLATKRGSFAINVDIRGTAYEQVTHLYAITNEGDQSLDVALHVAPPPTATVRGTVFNDGNGNGVLDGGDTGRVFDIVYADLNNNGMIDNGEPSVRTGDTFGQFIFAGLPADGRTIQIRLRNTPASRVTTPATGGYSVVLTPYGADDLEIGVRPLAGTATVSGVVFVDRNRSGGQDGGEVGFANGRVYADYNANKTLDAGEPSTLTDASGAYTLTTRRGPTPIAVVLAGTDYTVSDYYQASQVDTTDDPASVVARPTAIVPIAFGVGTDTGIVYTDKNANGKFDAGDVPLANRTVFADYNSDGDLEPGEISVLTGADGRYALNVPADGRVFTVQLQTAANEFAYFTGSTTPSQYFVETETRSGNDRSVSISTTAPTAGELYGLVFDDLNGNGVRDEGEPGLSGYGRTADNFVVFADTNGNGVQDNFEPTSQTTDDGYFRLTGLPLDTFDVDVTFDRYQEGPTKYQFSLPAGTSAQRVSLSAANSKQTGLQFGVTKTFAPHVSGTIFTDTNGNGVRDAGEPVAANAVVFADYAGTGFPRSNFPGLDSARTDVDGRFDFAVDADRPFVLRAAAKGDSYTYFPSPTTYALTLASKQTRAGLSFGVPPVTPVTIRAYIDGNRNGKFDGFSIDSSPYGGIEIWDDANLNGALDVGEASLEYSGALTAGVHHLAYNYYYSGSGNQVAKHFDLTVGTTPVLFDLKLNP